MGTTNSISTDRSLPESSFVMEEKVRLLYMQAPISNSVVIIISLLYYFLLQPRLDSNLLLLWMMLLLATASYRMYLWYSWKSRPEARPVASWLSRYLIGCGLVGSAWSLIYPFMYGTNDPFVLAALLMLAFGVISSAVPILSVYIPAFIIYTYPQALMLAITLLRFEDMSYFWLAFAVGVYMVMTTLFTRNINRSIMQSIKLQEQNTTLIEGLNSEINQRETLIALRTLELKEKNHDLIVEIKERERTEEKLQQANVDLDATLQAIPDLMFELDENGKYLDLWAQNTELLTAKKKDLIGRTVTEMLPAEAAHEVMAAIQGAAETGASNGQIIRLPLKHGVYWFELSTSRKQYTDGSSHFLMLSRNITDKQQMEDSLRDRERELDTIIEHIPNMLFIKEAKELRFVRFNKAGEELLGISSEQIVGKNDYDFFPKEQADFFTNNDRIVLASGNLKDIPEEPIETFNGERILHTRKIAIQGENNEPKYLLGISEDVTERKQADKEKERLQRELQQAHKMEALGQLTGGIAHDFNNILGIIMGYTGMALDRYGNEVPEKVVNYLETAMKASERAKDLVAQMLTFSRSGNGEAQPLQFTPLIKENTKMLHSILPSSIKIELNCEDNLPSILMDSAKLQQLLMNLCINAKDAMEGVGTLLIDLGWRRDVDTECSACHKRVEGDWIELSVADTGSGMTPEALEHLFEPFYTTKEIGKGTGMGMAVLHGIVSSHGGHTLIETELGKGTTFHLLFPPVVEEKPGMPEAVHSPDELPQGEGKDVLVVDDEAGLAAYIGDLLELYGYQSTIKTDSQEALSLFQENPGKFALLVTDQTMPRLTGVELIEQFREIRQDFPAILCTGYSETIDKEGAERRGIRYLGKPIDADKLVQSAGELLGLTKNI